MRWLRTFPEAAQKELDCGEATQRLGTGVFRCLPVRVAIGRRRICLQLDACLLATRRFRQRAVHQRGSRQQRQSRRPSRWRPWQGCRLLPFWMLRVLAGPGGCSAVWRRSYPSSRVRGAHVLVRGSAVADGRTSPRLSSCAPKTAGLIGCCGASLCREEGYPLLASAGTIATIFGASRRPFRVLQA